jgi:putative sterol carrier protein
MANWHNDISIDSVNFYETRMGCGHMQAKGLHFRLQYIKDFQKFKEAFEKDKHKFTKNTPHKCGTILHVDGENYMDTIEGGLPRYLKCMEELGFTLLTKYNNKAHKNDIQYLFILILE